MKNAATITTAEMRRRLDLMDIGDLPMTENPDVVRGAYAVAAFEQWRYAISGNTPEHCNAGEELDQIAQSAGMDLFEAAERLFEIADPLIIKGSHGGGLNDVPKERLPELVNAFRFFYSRGKPIVCYSDEEVPPIAGSKSNPAGGLSPELVKRAVLDALYKDNKVERAEASSYLQEMRSDLDCPPERKAEQEGKIAVLLREHYLIAAMRNEASFVIRGLLDSMGSLLTEREEMLFQVIGAVEFDQDNETA